MKDNKITEYFIVIMYIKCMCHGTSNLLHWKCAGSIVSEEDL